MLSDLGGASSIALARIADLWGRLDEARHNIVRTFERIGVELFSEPVDGM